jgi:DNA-binding MarR family transcriptional regulator
MTTAVKADPASEAWVLMMRIGFAGKQRTFQIAADFDLAPMQVHALRILESDMPMSALAGQLFCDASNVTGIVDRLESRELIERHPSPADRRVKLLRLTPAGVRLRDEVMARMMEAPEALKRLSREEQRQLRDLLRRASGPE